MNPSFTYRKGLLVQEQCVQLPYYPELCYIRGTLVEELPGFPKNGCLVAGRVVSEVLGLPLLVGWYTPLYQKICQLNPLAPVDGTLIAAAHAWNEDEERGLWPDISQGHYRGDLPSIVIRPKTTTVLKATPGLTRTARAMTLKQMSLEAKIERLVKQLKRALTDKQNKKV